MSLFHVDTTPDDARRSRRRLPLRAHVNTVGYWTFVIAFAVCALAPLVAVVHGSFVADPGGASGASGMFSMSGFSRAVTAGIVRRSCCRG